MFTTKDLEQISVRGITMQAIDNQIKQFMEGFPFMILEDPATVGNGIVRFDTKQIRNYVDHFDRVRSGFGLCKFVPASGAATRMFKDLFEYLSVNWSSDVHSTEKHFQDRYPAIYSFTRNLHKFAFSEDLKQTIHHHGNDLEDLLNRKDYATIIRYLLEPEGLNYASLPKGLLAFHRYSDEVRTAVDEHLVEGAQYCTDREGIVHIHFTVSPEHMDGFNQQINKVKKNYEIRYRVKYDISFSVQKPSTDTLAVNLNNEPFRNADGSLLFRPAGHGALIANLNELDTDIIFIKNIDNVVPDNLKEENNLYKKAIAGYLLDTRQKVFDWLDQLEQGDVTLDELQQMKTFAEEELYMDLTFMRGMELNESVKALYFLLNRPIRVCGMVKNVGEPGGGPFWIRNKEGKVSLQIVESSQVNLADPLQKKFFQQATHFNPVDLVCGIKDHKGNKFDLTAFIDHATGFISLKSKDGKDLKAMELPGLWNGAMAGWISVFVEVPLITFNPVKTVIDLLRKEHQVTS